MMSDAPSGQHFASTRWSLVLQAEAGAGSRARVALQELCRIYGSRFMPTCGATRRSPQEAEDITQV
ncbi:MAG: hypothetical protein KatS3mg110_4493 [Pirellulaceae bacterium]|nr:MAG: hypothetical protein KatS3mg110_4493 [Pirellulaceae bacterium]